MCGSSVVVTTYQSGRVILLRTAEDGTLNTHLRAFTRAMGTRFLPFPYWKWQRKIDVPHNLGGVPMGTS